MPVVGPRVSVSPVPYTQNSRRQFPPRSPELLPFMLHNLWRMACAWPVSYSMPMPPSKSRLACASLTFVCLISLSLLLRSWLTPRRPWHHPPSAPAPPLAPSAQYSASATSSSCLPRPCMLPLQALQKVMVSCSENLRPTCCMAPCGTADQELLNVMTYVRCAA